MNAYIIIIIIEERGNDVYNYILIIIYSDEIESKNQSDKARPELCLYVYENRA